MKQGTPVEDVQIDRDGRRPDRVLAVAKTGEAIREVPGRL